jgi:putative serine protease PepD
VTIFLVAHNMGPPNGVDQPWPWSGFSQGTVPAYPAPTYPSGQVSLTHAETRPEIGQAMSPVTGPSPKRPRSTTPGRGFAGPAWWIGVVTVVALVAALIGGGVGVAVGNRIAFLPDSNFSTAPVGAVEQVAARVLPAVVQLRVRAGNQAGTGSGIVLSPDGLLLTNNHVIEPAAAGAGQITVLFQNGESTSAQIIGRDPTSDIAVVKAQNVAGLTPIVLGNSDSVRVGQQVIAIGSPLGLGGTVTTGIVSALNRAVPVGRDTASNLPAVLDAIQTDAAINPGNSGGPLVDIQGRLIGINSAIASTGGGDAGPGGSVGLGFSIPVNQAKRIAEQLQRTGHATAAILGVQVASGSRLASLNDPPGAKIAAVSPNGPASKAGLKADDLIVKVNDRRVAYGDELVAAVRSLQPGDTITLLLSDGRSVPVVLDGQPIPASK